MAVSGIVKNLIMTFMMKQIYYSDNALNIWENTYFLFICTRILNLFYINFIIVLNYIYTFIYNFIYALNYINTIDIYLIINVLTKYVLNSIIYIPSQRTPYFHK